MKFENLIFDGALGSLLMKNSKCPIGYPLEKLNIENPDCVRAIHQGYVDAGSDVITTNSFGANPFRYSQIELRTIIEKSIILAKSVHSKYVAFDIGPLGKIIGEGGKTFDEAYDAFSEIVKCVNESVDFFLIETMTSLAEIRAAVIAIKENSKLPVIASMSFEKNLRTFFGTGVESFCVAMEALQVDALGANCSIGPEQMVAIAECFVKSTSLPILIQPNAGMPEFEKGETHYNTSPEDFFRSMQKVNDLGITMLGGCCGTTPDYIALLSKLKDSKVERQYYDFPLRLSSYSEVVRVDSFKVVGERINPTGKKALKKALIEKDYDKTITLAVEQSQQGADILDVNCGLSEINEIEALSTVVNTIQSVVSLPLSIDTSNPDALKKALRVYNGKALVNSVNASDESLGKILPIVKKYGAAVIGLCLDNTGIPSTAGERIILAKKILKNCESLGIATKNVVIDALTLAEASQSGNALTTLNTVKALSDIGIKTILGISNISFGMPNRIDINSKFLELAKENGLSLAIINPSLLGYSGSCEAKDFLLAKEGATEMYISYATSIPTPTIEKNFNNDLFSAILFGQKDVAKQCANELLATLPPMQITQKYVIPALDEVGKQYEAFKLFLPQLIAASEAAKDALSVLEAVLNTSEKSENEKIFVLATVKGDIHDIGKNIVKAVVSNYGYKVIDLGRDVAYEKVLSAVEKNYPCVLGLSALMTTTATNMQTTVEKVRALYPDIKILVGGAVITETFAKSIGAIYCKDATATAKQLKIIFKEE